MIYIFPLEGSVDGRFGTDVNVSRSEYGITQGTEDLAGLGDAVIDINAVVEGFVCDRPEVTKLTGDCNVDLLLSHALLAWQVLKGLKPGRPPRWN